MIFKTFSEKYSKQQGKDVYNGSLLSLDPGKTTGYACFKGNKLEGYGQLVTKSTGQAFDEIKCIIEKHNISNIVYEDYRVYKWKAKQHIGSELYTTRIIGVIETLCHIHNVEYVRQPAQLAKQFCTDKRLKEWRLWITGERHTRDAIKHACYYILFRN